MSIISDPVGRLLGNRYQLVAALGSGASAHVFVAEDLVLRRRVAVKVLQPALARDETFLRRFRAEARSVAAMNHPNVLQVFDWGEGTDGPYLVLEYLAGGSLFDMLSRNALLSPAQAARMGSQAAEGLAYAHGRGLVHRDVKPANLLFDEEGRVRVADFGVARALSATEVLTESGGTMLGTARYASPEQAQSQPLDGRSDAYSLALVLYEAVTGTVPFAKDALLDTLQARIGAPLPPDEKLGPLGEVLSSAAHPDVGERPDAATLAQRLRAVADQLPAAASLPLVCRAAPDETTLHSSSPGEPAENPATISFSGTVARAAGLGAGLLADAGEDTPSNPAAAADRYDSFAPPRRRARRRWPWVVAVAVVVACILAAGGVYAVRTHLFTPSHPVPSVVRDTVGAARRALTADHFAVSVAPAVQSKKVKSGHVVSESPASGTVRKEGTKVTVIPSKGPPSVTVPSALVRLNCSVATQLLTEAHLKAECPASSRYSETVPKGEVISWSYGGALDPKTAPYGSVIKATVSEGKPPVRLNNFAGQSWTTVEATLASDAMHPQEVLTYSTTVPAGQVISTTPGPSQTVPAGTTITVDVSKGPSKVVMPNVVGETAPKATAQLQKVHLKVGAVYGPATGKVFTTVPLAGQKVKVGSVVTLYTEKPGTQTGGTAGTGGTGGSTTGG